jgi:hypothetical protein
VKIIATKMPPIKLQTKIALDKVKTWQIESIDGKLWSIDKALKTV